MAHHAEASGRAGVKAHWGQRLGNIIAIVTLLTAAAAVYMLQFRKEPTPRGTGAPVAATHAP
jgi:hypothetical protein